MDNLPEVKNVTYPRKLKFPKYLFWFMGLVISINVFLIVGAMFLWMRIFGK